MSEPTFHMPRSFMGTVHLSQDGSVEGWCVYPDEPDRRATVELFVNGKIVRSMQATRMRFDQRGVGKGDGYCGFSFPLPSAVVSARANDERAILEVREGRFNSFIGRIILGSKDASRDRRFDMVDRALTAIDRKLAVRHDASVVIESTRNLGQSLLHLSRRKSGERTLGHPGLQACLEQIGAVPSLDLGWQEAPNFSLIISPGGTIAELAARIRSVVRALDGLEVEFILLEDGTLPITVLLPTRLRYLQLVRVSSAACVGSVLNAAAAAARGRFLAFSHRGGPHPADLRCALENARDGRLDLDVYATHPFNIGGSRLMRHGLKCIVARDVFFALGGFATIENEAEMWKNLVAKANALDLKLMPWNAVRHPCILGR